MVKLANGTSTLLQRKPLILKKEKIAWIFFKKKYHQILFLFFLATNEFSLHFIPFVFNKVEHIPVSKCAFFLIQEKVLTIMFDVP